MNVTELIASAYKDFALKPGINMIKVTGLLENFRSQINEERLFQTLDHLKMNLTQHEELVPSFIELFRNYFSLLRIEAFDKIHQAFKKSKEEGESEWLNFYTDGIIFFRPEIRIPLCEEKFPFEKKFTEELAGYKKLNRYISGTNWIDAYPGLEKLAGNQTLSTFQLSCLQIILGQIELYYFSNWQGSASRFNKAKEICPDNPRVELAKAEYEIRNNNLAEAKNILLTVISHNPEWYISYNLMGDCYKHEANLLAAEQWYNDAIRLNSLQTESHTSLLKLYTDKSWFKEKNENCIAALQKIAALEIFPSYDNELYHAYRNYADGLVLNEKTEEVEPYYEKAIQLRPELGIAYVDVAYFYIRQKEYDKALLKLESAKKLDEANFDVHWALAYLYELTEQNKKAFEAYERCLSLRLLWADQVYNFIANLYSKQKDYKEAIISYEKAIQYDPKNSVYKRNLEDLVNNIIKESDDDTDAMKKAELISFAEQHASDEYALNRIGNYYYNKKNFEKAMELYNKAILLDGTVSVFHENRGLALENLKNFDEAEKSYLKACELEDKSGAPFNSLGYFYFMQKRLSDATKYYEKAMEKEPNNPTFIQNLIRSYGDNGLYDKAEELNKKLVQLEPHNATSIAQLAFYQAAQNKNDEAMITIGKAYELAPSNDYVLKTMGNIVEKTGNSEKAMEFYTKSLETNPNDDITLNTIGIFYYRSGQMQKAIEFYKKAIEINPTVAVYYENLGLAYNSIPDLVNTEIAYKKLVELDPGNADAINNLGVVQYKLKKDDDAEKNYLAALHLDNDHPVYLENLAILYRAMDQKEKAIEAFENLLKVDQKNDINYSDLAGLYYSVGNYEKALENYQAAVQLKSSSLNYENLGLVYKALGKKEEEKDYYFKALSLEPESARLLNRLGVYEYTEKNFSEAINYYRKAIAKDAANPVYLENLALALYYDGDESNDDEAIDVYKKLVELSTTNSSALNELGILYYKKGLYSEAIASYTKAIMINPENPVFKENIALACVKEKKYKEAIQYYEAALAFTSAPDKILTILLNLGDVNYVHLKDYRKAIEYYEKALSLRKDDATTWKYLAEAYAAINDFRNADKAKKAYVNLSAVK